MKKKFRLIASILCVLWLAGAWCIGCGSKSEPAKAELADGTYSAQFVTDSSMFHVNEACDGRGTLTVTDGEMVIHVSLTSKNIVNLYSGLAKEAEKEGAELLEPTVDTVVYNDGFSEDVHGFDIPVPALDEEFDLALLGKKGKWYDHKVRVTDPLPIQEETEAQSQDEAQSDGKDGAQDSDKKPLADGSYDVDLTFEGGSGKAFILSPATVTVEGDRVTARVEWSSPNYDYMIVDGEKYLPINTEGNSVFEIPVSGFDEPMTVIADTVAMSKPHEVEYTITFHSKEELVYERSMELQYAEKFAVDYYEGGYVMLTTTEDQAQFLVVPEGKEAPEHLGEHVVVLRQPLENLYMVASAVMDLFRELDAIDTIRFSGQKEDGWYIDEARDAMQNGTMLYAGKYNMPDYELMLSEGCGLAIENTMITHAPEVIEKLDEFGIPTLIDYSSYETHPLGRVEWIRFYGALLGRQEQADAAFEQQMKLLESVSKEQKTGKTVAFFYITSNGTVNVRKTADYIPQMIGLAGGTYIFRDLGSDTDHRSSVNLTMEEFYATAKDADVLIYNSTIDGELQTVEELIGKSAQLRDFQAVKEGNVWCTTNDLYQHTMSVGAFVQDLHSVLTGGNSQENTYIFLLK